MTIEMLHVMKSFGGKAVLKDINWNISSDDTWLLCGPEGAGKTTLLHIIIGLIKPDQGQVNLLGDYKYDRVNAGVVFQEDRLCPGFSAVENVAMVNARLSERTAKEELLKLIPEGLVSLPVETLDPVTRRFVCIVRAAIIPSDLLLLDAPFAGMTEEQQAKAYRYIRDKAGHKGIVIAQRDDQGLSSLRKLELSL